MNGFQTMLSAALFVLLGSTGLAQASTIDVDLGISGSDISFRSGSNIPSPNLHLATLGSGLFFNSNSQIISPAASVVNQYTQPSGALYDNNFLAVRGLPTAGMATFSLGPNLNDFAFTWGSIDAYNSLVLKDSRNVTYTITGADLLNLIANSTAGVTQADVSFVDLHGSLTIAQLISTNNAFEAANFSATDPPSGVPLPPALPLFATAMIGLLLLARRRTV